MKQRKPDCHASGRRSGERGSVLVIVLLIAAGMISIALYFANSMALELRASDNRASGLAAEQAIEGAARYVSLVLDTYGTNGMMPYRHEYLSEAVPVGASTRPEENARFWLIGRDHNTFGLLLSSQPGFGLVDEAGKLDLNAPWLDAEVLATNFPNMTYEFAEAIIDWRSTNGSGGSSLNYSSLGYLPKHAPFESVGELRLVYGCTPQALAGEDINRNGVLDPNEQDLNRNGRPDPGLMEFVTVFSREPNIRPDGLALTNVNNRANLQPLLQERLGSSRATEVSNRLFQVALARGGGNSPWRSLLDFYIASRMTADEFALIYRDVTITNAAYTVGRVNINTAPAEVLACLPGMDLASAQQLVTYRESGAVNFSSIAWIVDALGSEHPAIQSLRQGDYITAKSFQFSADIAAVGPFGRGYRRARMVFDTTEGTPKVIYRQDLSRLGWALGRETREHWVARSTR